MTACGIAGQYFWGYICDRNQTVKKVFIVCLLGLAAVVVPYQFYTSPVAVIAAMGVIGFLWNPASSIIDSWILESSSDLARNYGFMRAWGSIGFALLASVFGTAIEKFGWGLMFSSFGILALVTVGMATTIEDSHKPVDNKPRQKANPVELFKNLDYLLLMVVSLLIFIPANTVTTFLPVMLKGLGGTATHQGLALFAVAISEFPILVLARRFVSRLNAQLLLLIAGTFYFLRIVLMLLAQSPTAIILIGLLQSVTFGIYLPTVRHYVNQIAPDGLKTTAQTAITAVFFGAASIVASLAGGMVMDRYGLGVLLTACVAISALAVLMLAVMVLRSRAGREVSSCPSPKRTVVVESAGR